ncbi:alpha,alpha-trehalase TreF [Lacihabitans lacunae]|uniref:Alpha,alpha-trehalase TreF n=1 Tax=Lacihabitans lacunae TaxID=1028214 RepID=A0ABV7Z0I9_9BACT
MKTVLDFPDFFKEIQLSGYFADSKTFPDLEPKKSIGKIVDVFFDQKENENFSLPLFLNENFYIPENNATSYTSDESLKPEDHLHQLWKHLSLEVKKGKSNTTYISMPHGFVVPGGRFQEVYYWDSYFTMLGLIVSKKFQKVEDMIANFGFLIDTYGFIPNGNRTYFLSRSQPPFFALMVALLETFDGKLKAIDFLPQLKKEYAFWMKNQESLSTATAIERVVKLNDGTILNRYFDNDPSPRPESYEEDVHLSEKADSPEELFLNLRAACESGWDFSSRWLEDPMDLATIKTTELLPVDLNCLLYNLEKYISELSEDETEKAKYEHLAATRKSAILKYFWNEEKQFFFDYNIKSNSQSTSLTLAGVFPLFFEVATTNQAQSVAQILQEKFLKPGGLVTTLSESGQQWDSPNGWAPLQWLSIKGLLKYKQNDLAKKVSDNWLALNTSVYINEGKFTEKYNVATTDSETGGGEYPNQDGFGWTNGVFLDLKSKNL